MRNNIKKLIIGLLIMAMPAFGCANEKADEYLHVPEETAEAENKEEATETAEAELVEEVKDYSNASLSDITNYSEIMSNFFPAGLYGFGMVSYDESDSIQPADFNEMYRVEAPYTTLPDAISYLKLYFSAEMIRRMHDYFIPFRVFNGNLYYCIPARGFGGYNYETGVLDHVEPDGTYVVEIMYENVGSGMYKPTYHYFKEIDGKFLLVDVDFNGTEDEVVTNSCIGLVTINVEHLRIRTGAGTSFPQINEYWKEASLGGIYPVYEIQEAEEYSWYRIGEDKWIANDGSWATLYEIS